MKLFASTLLKSFFKSLSESFLILTDSNFVQDRPNLRKSELSKFRFLIPGRICLIDNQLIAGARPFSKTWKRGLALSRARELITHFGSVCFTPSYVTKFE